jgi:hypothetical protein
MELLQSVIVRKPERIVTGGGVQRAALARRCGRGVSVPR